MTKLFYLIVVPLLFVASLAQAQKHTYDSVEPVTIIKQIQNDQGQPYNLIITLPINYNSQSEYKILYYLDAWWLKGLVTGSYRIKSLSDKTLSNRMEEVILVGISSVGDERDWNRQRNMDFTPSPFNSNLTITIGEESLNEKTTGGAEEFLQFFENHIISSIESEYKVESESRGLLGHSLGGLLGFYAYVNKSDLFSNFILIAPSVWWNDSELLPKILSIERDVNMFVAMGTAEINMMKRPMAKLIEELTLDKNKKLKMTYRQYENADHHSVLPQAIYDGIEFLFTNPKNSYR